MNYPFITSRKNTLVRFAASLQTSAEARRENRLFICEGARLCEDAVRSGLAVQQCFLTVRALEKYGDGLSALLSAGEAGKTQIYLVDESVAALLSATKSTQGVFCVCEWPTGLWEEVPPGGVPLSSCVVLENLQDPGNLGTVLRTAEALGVEWVVLCGESCDVLSPKVVRSAMGAVFRCSILVQDTVRQVACRLKPMGYKLLGAVPDSGAMSVTQIDFSGELYAVLIGNEGNGLSAEALKEADSLVTIPMNGRAESLNASAAATILLWEMARKENYLHG